MAALASQGRGTSIGAHQQHIGIGDGLVNGHHDVGEGDAGDDVNLVALHELLRQLHAQVSLELVVFLDHLNRRATEFSAQVLDAQHEGVVLVLAERASRTREGAHETNLDRLGLRAQAHCCQTSRHHHTAELEFHRNLLVRKERGFDSPT